MQTGVRVEFTTPSGDVDGTTADVWLIPPAELPRWAAAGKLREILPHYLQSDHAYAWLDILPIYRHKMLTWDARVYGLPLLGDATLCYVREDLLRDADNRSAFKAKHDRELAAPNSWEDFVDLAEFFHGRTSASDRQPLSGFAPLSLEDEGLDREFYSIAAAVARRGIREDDKQPPPDEEIFSFHYDITSGATRMDHPGMRAAWQLWQRLRRCRPVEGMHDPELMFRAGRAALCIAGTRWISRFHENGSPIRGRFSTCRVPGSLNTYSFRYGEPVAMNELNYVPYLGCGGWLAVVPTNAANPDEAFSLMAELSGPQASGEILLNSAWSGGVFRNQHLALIGRGSAFELDARQTQRVVEQLRLAMAPPIINPLLRLRIPDQDAHFRSMAAGLRNGTTLEQVADAWRRIDEHVSPQQRLRDYRLSLSLPAQSPR